MPGLGCYPGDYMELTPHELQVVTTILTSIQLICPTLTEWMMYWERLNPLTTEWFMDIILNIDDVDAMILFLWDAVNALNGVY